MKREDFKIEGIPEGYRVYDVDLTPSGRPVAVLGHATDRTFPVFARWHGADVHLPDDALWWNDHIETMLLASLVRAVGDDLLLVVMPWAESSDDVNAWVWDTRAEAVAEFHAGEDVQEVLAREDLALLFYGDQGQTGDNSLSREGMAVVSAAGEYLWGHWSQFGKEEGLHGFFHAAAWADIDSVALFADVAWECAFVRLDLQRRRQRVWQPPLPFATPSAVTTKGDRVIVHGAGTDSEGRKFLESLADPGLRGKMQRTLQGGGLDESLSRQLVEYSTSDPRPREMLASGLTHEDIVEWRPGETTWRVIGEWPDRQLRGLPGGRFIAVQPDGYTILSFD